MATEAQTNANRVNSQKSTGPRTPQGKAAVSQNARKHGLFASPTVIRGEDQGQFDLYREAMLGEMRPVGPAESMLATRIVNLAWRLGRAEGMQDQALQIQAKSDMLYLVTRQVQWSYREANGLPQEESQPKDDHMTLGRAARNDIANYRVLDRLLLYERRIENSMYKTMKELRKLQAARKAEEAGAIAEQPAADKRRHRADDGELKKQSQFAGAKSSVRAFAAKDYDDKPSAAVHENKANQSQSPAFSRKPETRSSKSEKSGFEKTKPICLVLEST